MAATLIRQLYSRSVWLADGSTTVWNFSFSGGYIDKTHVNISVRNPGTGMTEVIPLNYDTDFIGPYQISVVPAIAAGMEFRIFRTTPGVIPLLDFTDGARISEVSLDTNSKQAIFLITEMVDAVQDALFDNSGGGGGGGGSLFQTLLDDEYGYKSLRHMNYSGASIVQAIDNGRGHYKTDATSVTVPSSLKVEFLSSIINNSGGTMSVSFAETAHLQGTAVAKGLYTLAANSMLHIHKVAAGKWYISGNAS